MGSDDRRDCGSPSRRFRTPRTRYANSGGASIAYQVVGEAPSDLAPGPRRCHVELQWESPAFARFFERLRGDGSLATFDGPARAIRCGHAIAEAARSLGLEVRIGLVSRTVKDLVAGSGMRFVDRGTTELRGMPDETRLFAAVP